MKKIAKNIYFLRRNRGLTQEKLAEALDITRSRVGSYEEGRSDPGIDVLIQLSDYFKLPVDALLRHDLSRSENQSFIEIGNQRVLFPIIVNQGEKELIEVINAKASAGYLNGYADPEFIEQLEKIQLPFLPTGKHRAFPIKGDSMLPLKDGSYVVARFVEDINDLVDGKTYVLLTLHEGIVYKRIYKKGTNALLLTSDNKTYTPFEVAKQDILELWEFTCSIHMNDYEESELRIDGIQRMLRDMQVELESLKG
ncbi:MAG: LexA family transcriptional regulator [Cyclobacteriaceae bacterium]|nr:LexA family transcriptional regulator [Cyclobacteriaceae bacterium]